ncbi:uncharacterized protein [Anas platyrhynchos]|uniref:uncharacterized protein n=1 Tax=Anas platyrhynchos TaxID=8839 RepID=UPI003AF28276
MADMWGMSFFPIPEAFWAFYSLLWLLLMAVACYFLMPGAKPQEGRKTRHHCRRHRENRRVWTLHNSSWRKRNQCPEHAKVDGVRALAKLFNTNLEDLNKYMEMLNLELPEDSGESPPSDIESDTSCSSRTSLDSWHTIFCTTVTEDEITQISRAPTPTPVQKADSRHGSAVQPGLMHPKAGPGKQRYHDTRPPCRKEVVRCHRASSVQQHVQVQQAAPTHLPAVPKLQSTKMKTSLPQKKSKEALIYITPKKRKEQKLRLPAEGEKPPRDDRASALKVSKQEEKSNEKKVPTVWDVAFIDEAEKNRLERAVEKLYIQKQFGLSEMLLSFEESFSATVLEARTAVPTTAPQSPQKQAEPHVVSPVEKDPPCAEKTVNSHLEGPNGQKQTKGLFRLPRNRKRSSDPVLGQKDTQTEALQRKALQRNTMQRQRSPRLHFQQHVHTTKSAVQLSEQTPGPQQEAAAPKDTLTKGMKEPVKSVPAPVLRVAQEMKPQKGEDKPRQKTGCGGRANGSSTTSKTTRPGTSKKNRGPGAAGLVCSPSPSTQAEQASPQSKGAPRGQSDKKGDGPSISATGDMGTPAPPRRRPPRRKHSSSGDRPSTLPRPPHHIWIALDMPHIPEVLAARKECRKAKQIAKDLEKQVQASQLKQLPDNAGQARMDTAAEGTGAVPRRRHRRARKNKGCSQDRPVFARLRPKCIRAPNHNLPGTESSQDLAPSAAAVPGAVGGNTVGETKSSQNLASSTTAVPGAAGGETVRQNESSQNLAKSATAVPGAVEGKTVEKKKPSTHRAKGQQGQKNISATQQPEGRNRVLIIPVCAEGKLLRRLPGTGTIIKLCSQNHKKRLNPGVPIPFPV